MTISNKITKASQNGLLEIVEVLCEANGTKLGSFDLAVALEQRHFEFASYYINQHFDTMNPRSICWLLDLPSVYVHQYIKKVIHHHIFIVPGANTPFPIIFTVGTKGLNQVKENISLLLEAGYEIKLGEATPLGGYINVTILHVPTPYTVL